MGILSRKQGDNFVITSDRKSTDAPTNRAPRKAMSDVYEVWTGKEWSAITEEAIVFDTLDAADEYVRANYAQIAPARK